MSVDGHAGVLDIYHKDQKLRKWGKQRKVNLQAILHSDSKSEIYSGINQHNIQLAH